MTESKSGTAPLSAANAASERRQFWRAVFHSPVRVSTPGGRGHARLLDVSLKGALLETGAAWHGDQGESCELSIDLAPGVVIVMHTTIVHRDSHHAGLRCDSIDLDSITHLRRLVELNAGDAELLERELATLIHEA